MACNHDDCVTAFCPTCGVKIPTLSKDQKLATLLHTMLCDGVLGCRWRHEKTWVGTSHAQHLKAATEMHKLFLDDEIVSFVSISKLIKEHGL